MIQRKMQTSWPSQSVGKIGSWKSLARSLIIQPEVIEMPWWHFAEQSIVDPNGVAHRRNCPKAPNPDDGVRIEEDEVVVRSVAPSACRVCKPAMSMRLGNAGIGPQPRRID
jgi:hypothetical protein